MSARVFPGKTAQKSANGGKTHPECEWTQMQLKGGKRQKLTHTNELNSS